LKFRAIKYQGPVEGLHGVNPKPGKIIPLVLSEKEQMAGKKIHSFEREDIRLDNGCGNYVPQQKSFIFFQTMDG